MKLRRAITIADVSACTLAGALILLSAVGTGGRRPPKLANPDRIRDGRTVRTHFRNRGVYD